MVFPCFHILVYGMIFSGKTEILPDKLFQVSIWIIVTKGQVKVVGEYQHVTQPFIPVYNNYSKILILGSFPSVKSREQGFYYGHPQNRFWKVLSEILGEQTPYSIEEKKNMLLINRVAIYDVIESCDIIGSSDSSIRNVVPADIKKIIKNSEIGTVFTNGKTSAKLYRKYQAKDIGLPMIELPSTSPANAVFSLERLKEIWKREIQDYL